MPLILLWAILIMVLVLLATNLRGTYLRVFYLALSTRIAAWILHYLGISLPYTGRDEAYFLDSAAAVAADDFRDLAWDGTDLFIRILSWLLHTFNANPALLSALTVIAGTGVAIGCAHFIKVLAPGTNSKLLLLPALHPTLIIFSVAVTREAWIQGLIVLTFFAFLKSWTHNHHTTLYNILAVAALLLAGLLHSGVFALFVGAMLGILWLVFSARARSSAGLLRTLVVGSLVVLVVTSTGLGLRKFESRTSDGNFAPLEELDERLLRLEEGGSSFRLGGVPTFRDAVFQLPIRAIYMAAGPLPVHYRSPNDILAGLDGALWVFLYGTAARSVGNCSNRNRALFIVSLAAIAAAMITFSFGTSTFGTALRHRAKFLPFVSVLGVAALLHRRRARALRTDIPTLLPHERP